MEKGSCNLLLALLKANLSTLFEECCVSARKYTLVGFKGFLSLQTYTTIATNKIQAKG